MLKILTSACVLAMLAFTSTTTHAQTIDNRTFFTFSGPVTLPGVTLPAGKYLFRNPDTLGGRRVVQVLSEDGLDLRPHARGNVRALHGSPQHAEGRIVERLPGSVLGGPFAGDDHHVLLEHVQRAGLRSRHRPDHQ